MEVERWANNILAVPIYVLYILLPSVRLVPYVLYLIWGRLLDFLGVHITLVNGVINMDLEQKRTQQTHEEQDSDSSKTSERRRNRVIHLSLNSKHSRMIEELSDRWGYQPTHVLRELIRREYMGGKTNEIPRA